MTAPRDTTPRHVCPVCEGRGVLLAYTPAGLPRCPACEGRGSLTAAQLAQVTAAPRPRIPGGAQ
ncbi:hypothetical protein ACINK0_03020 [Deinococcus sp. VB343]|uniref:hypothetical protein n=1 Tax=Deinococcus sp. VB343 TaxID=3385567 RepID=UPI0039C96D88